MGRIRTAALITAATMLLSGCQAISNTGKRIGAYIIDPTPYKTQVEYKGSSFIQYDPLIDPDSEDIGDVEIHGAFRNGKGKYTVTIPGVTRKHADTIMNKLNEGQLLALLKPEGDDYRVATLARGNDIRRPLRYTGVSENGEYMFEVTDLALIRAVSISTVRDLIPTKDAEVEATEGVAHGKHVEENAAKLKDVIPSEVKEKPNQ